MIWKSFDLKIKVQKKSFFHVASKLFFLFIFLFMIFLSVITHNLRHFSLLVFHYNNNIYDIINTFSIFSSCCNCCGFSVCFLNFSFFSVSQKKKTHLTNIFPVSNDLLWRKKNHCFPENHNFSPKHFFTGKSRKIWVVIFPIRLWFYKNIHHWRAFAFFVFVLLSGLKRILIKFVTWNDGECDL